MKISSAQLNLSSSHLEVEQREVSERLRTWTGERPRFANEPAANRNTAGGAGLPAVDSAPTRLSDAARVLAQSMPPDQTPAAGDSAETSAIAAAMDNANNDPVLLMLRGMLERLFGIRVHPGDDSDPAPASGDSLQKNPPDATFGPPAGANNRGIEYEYHEQRTEIETTRFAAEGVVKTEDGAEFRFELSIEMTRVFSERIDIAFRAGETARKKDPLMMNFAGRAAQLSDRRFEIDLDGDGQRESARFAARGSGFLVFDRNGDGKIGDGKEMFGPTSGDGFAELATFDDDGNGWIDENDPIYARLQVWSKAEDGSDILRSLREANVGAIALARLATPFAIKDTDNALLGQVRSSSVYLGNDGKVGTVQQVDLAV